MVSIIISFIYLFVLINIYVCHDSLDLYNEAVVMLTNLRTKRLLEELFTVDITALFAQKYHRQLL